MKLTVDEYTHLKWLYHRMVEVHGENHKIDYMVKFWAFLQKHDPTPNQGKDIIPAICPTCKKVLPQSLLLQGQHYQEHITEFWARINELIEKHSS